MEQLNIPLIFFIVSVPKKLILITNWNQPIGFQTTQICGLNRQIEHNYPTISIVQTSWKALKR